MGLLPVLRSSEEAAPASWASGPGSTAALGAAKQAELSLPNLFSVVLFTSQGELAEGHLLPPVDPGTDCAH